MSQIVGGRVHETDDGVITKIGVVQSRSWLRLFVIALFICAAVYIANSFLGEVHPYTIWGIGYGAAATLLMLGVALWGVRRRTMSFMPARSQSWVQFHVYGGVLFLLLMFMHTGFRLPSGALTWWIFVLSIWVSLSGLIGVVLQKTIPRVLASGLSIEVHYNRIPELIDDVRKKSETLIETAPESVREYYTKELAPVMVAPRPRWIYYLDVSGGIHGRLKQFDYLRRFLSPEEKEKLNQLQNLYTSKLEMDAHYTLQRLLRYWLYFHVPVSLVLILLVGIHVFTVLYY